TVIDAAPPTVVTQNITVQLGADGTATITPEQIDNGSSDASGIQSLSLSQTSFDCNDVGVVQVTLTVTDINDISNTGTALVEVLDVLPIDALDDTIELTSCESITFNVADLIGNDTDPYNEDLIVDFVGQPSSGTIVDNNNGTWTYTPGSSASHSATASYIVKRDDGTIVFSENGHFYEYVSDPNISWEDARDAAAAMSYNGMQGYLVTITSAAENQFAFDKLDDQAWIGATDTETENEWRWVTGPEAGTFFYDQSTGQAQNGAYTNWQANEPNNYGTGEDYAHFRNTGEWNDFPLSASEIQGYIVEYGGMDGDCDIDATATATITFSLNDTENPVISAPADITTLATSAAGAVVNYTAPVGTDNCDVTTSLTAGLASGATFPLGTTTVTYTATDASGNEASASFDVTVEGVLPVVTAADISASTDPGSSTAVVNFAATDNVGVPSSTISYSIPPGSSFPIGATEVTATATNAVGTASTVFTVTVSDDDDPVVITQDVTVYLDENGNASISSEQIDNGSTDNSGGQLSFSLDQSTFDCDDLGARNEATIVSDNTWSQSTESINTPQPFASVISSLPAASTYTLGATVDDPYGQDNFFSPAIPGAQAIRSFGYMKFFRNNFELTGRPQSLRLRARVDNVMEIFINGVSIGYEGDFDGANFSGPVYHDLFIDGNGVQNGYEEGMKFDKVTSASILDLLQAGDNEIVFAIGNSNNNTDDGGFMVRMDAVADGVPVELTVTDPSGNTSTGQAFVVVKDEIDPTITLNGDAVVQHEAYTAYTDLGATASDNCSANLTTDNPVDVNTPGSYTVTYTALDGSGNETIATRTVQIVDSTDPEVLVKKITIELDANGQVTIAGIDVDNGSNDASGIASYELSHYTFGCDDLGDNGVTLTVTDNNGRTASAITTVIVEDNIAPTAITQNITVYLDENGNASITPDQINNGSFDNCEVENLTLDIDSFTCDDLGENTVTLTAWDGPVGEGLTGFQLDQSRPSSINFGPATGYSVLSADMNGDGNIDLIYGGYCGYQNEVRISDGNGNFTVIPFGTNAGGDCVEQIDVADVDGDGDIDVVVSRPARVFLNDGNGNLTESQVIGGARRGINLADYDGDGDVDLAYGGPGAPSIYKNNGSGNFTLFSTIAGSYGENDYYEDGDIDGDGDIDLIIAQRASNNQPPNDVYINDGNGNFTAKGLNLGTNSYSKPLVQDLDGDGDLDLVFANNNASQPTPVWFNDGAGNFTNVQNIAPNTSTFG
ncbi:MAG: HYR domain-containing protein, partial [Cytophagia bacterium]|nr:HYR domain-containing protein [Cytophagia bacterium]